jgi:glutamine synthetase
VNAGHPSRAWEDGAVTDPAAGDHLVAFLYADAAGLARGRAVPGRDLERRLRTGVGWVPADQAISALGPLAHDNPWGSIGDLRLLPDPATETRADLWPGLPPLHLLLCDAVHVDGRPWDSCPRILLRSALARLQAETGLELRAAFEHEFVLEGHAARPPSPFTYEALQLAEPLGAQVSRALRENGHELETFLPEFGANQFELTCAPRDGLAAADQAAIVRELVREIARRLGWRATFAPLLHPDGSGNGAHLHLSLLDGDGRPALHDAARPGGLSIVGGRFAAGVLRHLPAICAVAAPTAVSYLRLVPHRWSAGWACLGYGNRETVLRMPEPASLGGAEPSAQLNLELRAPDGACSPHLTLALVVLAGLEAIAQGAGPATIAERDPERMTDAERGALTSGRIPATLEEALEAFDADELVRRELSEDLRRGYVAMKRTELELVAGLEPREICARYAAVH